jgi:hypothetical protein
MSPASISVACPVCGLAGQEGPVCRRCKADLGLLCSLEQSRQELLARGRGLLCQARSAEALSATRRALALRRDRQGVRLLALCYLMRHEFAEALAAYQADACRDPES